MTKIKCWCCDEEKHIDFIGAICVMVDEKSTSECRSGILCCDCSERMGHDMWSCESEWNSINPKIRFEQLPVVCVTHAISPLEENESEDEWRWWLFSQLEALRLAKENADKNV